MAVDKRKAKRRLEEMMMNVSRHQSYLEAYRNHGDASAVARSKRWLNLHYSSIRKHCTEHNLPLPHGVPSEGAD